MGEVHNFNKVTPSPTCLYPPLSCSTPPQPSPGIPPVLVQRAFHELGELDRERPRVLRVEFLGLRAIFGYGELLNQNIITPDEGGIGLSEVSLGQKMLRGVTPGVA